MRLLFAGYVNRSLHQNLMHSRSGGATVPNVCLQDLTLSLPSPGAIFSTFPQTESLFTDLCVELAKNDTREPIFRIIFEPISYNLQKE